VRVWIVISPGRSVIASRPLLKEVQEHLLELNPIRVHGRHVGAELEADRDAVLPCAPPRRLVGGSRHVVHVHALRGVGWRFWARARDCRG
jgi:hypothetical protein